MKKFILGLLTLVALVVVSNVAKAQSTPLQPYNGATEIYEVTGLTAGDNVLFFITDDTHTDFADGSIAGDTLTSGGGVFTWASTHLYSADGTDSVSVQWNTGGGLTVYHLWIRVQDQSSNCYNYRYVEITPQDNDWDVSIAAIAVADTTTLPSNPATATFAEEGADSTQTCPVIEDDIAEYNDTISGGAQNDGATFVYYRVERANAADIDNDWTFTFDLDVAFTDGGAYQGTAPIVIESSEDFSTWSPAAEGSITVTSATNVYYLRVGYSASTTNTQFITAWVDGAQGTGGASDPSEAVSGLTDSDNATDDVTVELQPIPAIPDNAFGF